jgi:hypothetical protein
MAANKITETITLKIAGTSLSASVGASVTTDQVGSNYNEETQLITAAVPVKIDISPDIADGNLGYFIARNLSVPQSGVLPADSTYVDIATDAAMVNKIATMQPGRGHYSPPPAGTVNLWAQAHGADVQIIFLAIET